MASDSEVIQSRRGRNFLVGLLLALGPIPVYLILFFLTFTWATNIVDSVYITFLIIAELFGPIILLRCVRKKADAITIGSILASGIGIFLLIVSIWRITTHE